MISVCKDLVSANDFLGIRIELPDINEQEISIIDSDNMREQIASLYYQMADSMKMQMTMVLIWFLPTLLFGLILRLMHTQTGSISSIRI